MGDPSKFSIGFDRRDLPRLQELWEGVVDSQRWSEGGNTEEFERLWAGWNGCGSVAFSGWTGGALAALEFAGVRGEKVVCPSNTFMATPLAVQACGGEVVFADCNREDLCLSVADLERAISEHRPKAVIVVHIGGHIAFGIEQIAELCRSEGIFLIEDCAHAHGAHWNGRRPGTWGDAGVYSFYATKTVSTGEGGMLVSRDERLLDFARSFRNYGKPEYASFGLNFRMSEFTAAIGVVQADRMEEIVEFKRRVAREELDPVHQERVRFPEGMESGFYKYIVFTETAPSTGKVYDEPCHQILGQGIELPNTDWVAENHWCVPLYYQP